MDVKTAMRVWRKREVDGRNDGAKNTPSSAPPRTRKRTRRRGGEDERWPRAGVQHLQPGRAATPVWKKGRWRYRPLRSAPGPKGRGGGSQREDKKEARAEPAAPLIVRSASTAPLPSRSVRREGAQPGGRQKEGESRATSSSAHHGYRQLRSAPHQAHRAGEAKPEG